MTEDSSMYTKHMQWYREFRAWSGAISSPDEADELALHLGDILFACNMIQRALIELPQLDPEDAKVPRLLMEVRVQISQHIPAHAKAITPLLTKIVKRRWVEGSQLG